MSKIICFASQTHFGRQSSFFASQTNLLRQKSNFPRSQLIFGIRLAAGGAASPRHQQPNVYLNRPPPKSDKLFEINLLEHRIGHLFVRPVIFARSVKKCRKLHMLQSRRHEGPRSSRLQHSASFRAAKPNKASMTLMLAAAGICATDALERQLAPPGFECCERELLGRPKRRD